MPRVLAYFHLDLCRICGESSPSTRPQLPTNHSNQLSKEPQRASEALRATGKSGLALILPFTFHQSIPGLPSFQRINHRCCHRSSQLILVLHKKLLNDGPTHSSDIWRHRTFGSSADPSDGDGPSELSWIHRQRIISLPSHLTPRHRYSLFPPLTPTPCGSHHRRSTSISFSHRALDDARRVTQNRPLHLTPGRNCLAGQ